MNSVGELMKKAINLYFCELDTKTKLEEIKSAGYGGVLLGVNEKNETMTLAEQIELMKKLGLEISMIHCKYDGSKLNYLWENGEFGDEVERDLINQIEKIKDFGVNVNFVVHTCGNKFCKTNKIGIVRIGRILKVCEKYNINLCIENLYLASQVKYIFKNLKSKNLKFCFDSGHENFLTPGERLEKKYANLLVTTHIHDNNGLKDEHMIIGRGTINQDKMAEDLAKSNSEFLTAEIKYFGGKVSVKEILKDNLTALNELDKKINMHKGN